MHLKIKNLSFLGFIFLSFCTNNREIDAKMDTQSYPFLLQIDGPYTLNEIFTKKDILIRKEAFIFDTDEKPMYILKLTNYSNDKIFLKTDRSTGFILINYRFYLPVINNKYKYKLVYDNPIIDYNLVDLDSIMPNETKSYCSTLYLPDFGGTIIEFYIPIKSRLVDSLNSVSAAYREKLQISVHYPFFLFDLKDNRLYPHKNENNFHEKVY